MYRNIQNIVEVKKYHLWKDDVFIVDNNNDLIINNDTIAKNVFDTFICKDFLMCNTENSICKINLVDHEKSIIKADSQMVTSLRNLDCFVFSVNPNRESNELYCRIDEHDVLITVNYNWEFIYCLNKYDIILFDKKTILWYKIDVSVILKPDLSKNEIIIKILGHNDDCLWIWCENYAILCLNLNTGEIFYNWQPFKGIFEDGQFYFNFPYFDEKNCKVLFFERSYFIECDLQTQTTHIIWQDDKVNLNIIACSFTSDFLYFVAANRGRVVDRILGVFDIKLCGKRN